MPDPFKSTLEEIRERLEDHRGNLERVSAEELLKVLNPTPKIVILSACDSARQEPFLLTKNTIYTIMRL